MADAVVPLMRVYYFGIIPSNLTVDDVSVRRWPPPSRAREKYLGFGHALVYILGLGPSAAMHSHQQENYKHFMFMKIENVSHCCCSFSVKFDLFANI